MSDIDRILNLARQQVGVTESPPGSNNVKYNTDYYGGPVDGAAFPWCCSFIWWLFYKLGISDEFCGGAKTAYCPYVVNYARNTGRWITNGQYKPGDLILYDWNGDGSADHIGICLTWNGVNGQIIEGNAGDAVSLLTRSISQIMGAYRPAYREDNPAPQPPVEPDTPPQDETPPDDGMDGAYIHTVKQGESLWLIAQLYDTTIQELARLNNIDPSGFIYPGQVLKVRAMPADNPTIITPDDVYTVRQGDSLWIIAKALLGSGWKWPKIAEANDITYPYTIYPGQKLKIPREE